MGLTKNTNFILLWLAHAISSVGDVLYDVGVIVTIYQKTGSTLQTIGVAIANTLPSFLFGPIAGSVVDRHSYKLVMIAMDVIRAIIVASFLVFWDQQSSVYVIYGVIAALATARTFYYPAWKAVLPSIVERQQLVRANSLMMTTEQSAYVFGYALGGIIVVYLGFTVTVVVDLISFIIAALAISFLAFSDISRITKKKTSIYRQTMEAVYYLKNHNLARSLIIMEWLEYIPHGIWSSAMILAFTEKSLHGDAIWWGYQNGSYCAGQLVGAIIATLIASQLARKYAGRTIAICAFVFGVLTIVYALSPTLLFAVIICFPFGPIYVVRDVIQDSLLQSHIDKSMIGRVYAARAMGGNLLFMIAVPIFAWMADHISPRWIYTIGGSLYIATAIYAFCNYHIMNSRVVK